MSGNGAKSILCRWLGKTWIPFFKGMTAFCSDVFTGDSIVRIAFIDFFCTRSGRSFGQFITALVFRMSVVGLDPVKSDIVLFQLRQQLFPEITVLDRLFG